MSQTSTNLIPLPAAAFRLRRSWASTYALLLQGELRGERRGSRWFVREADVEQFERNSREPTRSRAIVTAGA